MRKAVLVDIDIEQADRWERFRLPHYVDEWFEGGYVEFWNEVDREDITCSGETARESGIGAGKSV